MSEEWGPWIEHDGDADAPSDVDIGYVVAVYSRHFGYEEGRVNQFCHWEDVIRYRIRKPRGLLILERIAATSQEEQVPA